MKVLDIGLKRPAILPPTSVTMMIFQTMKVLRCLRVTEDAYIGLFIPSNISLLIAEFIIVVMMLEVDLGINRPSTLPLSIV